MAGQITHSQHLAELASHAEAGDSNAAFELEEIYHKGEVLSQDWKIAFRWYRLGATQGDADSHNSLGTLYQNGLDCEPDSVLASHWYRQSAQQVNPVASSISASASKLAMGSTSISPKQPIDIRWRPGRAPDNSRLYNPPGRNPHPL